MDADQKKSLKVLIAGCGPAGCACALSLIRLGAQAGRWVDVKLFEHKSFGQHYNQCMGVLSPPIQQIMHDLLELEIPRELVQREIEGYWLHTGSRSIYLTDSSPAGPRTSIATRRVLLDGYLLNQAKKAGVEVFGSRVIDFEFSDDCVRVYTEGGSFTGDVVVGAFGLDRQLCDAFSRRTGYRAPDYLETVVTKIHPGQENVERFQNRIHAFLPSRPEIEFGALVPKGDHITALVAGRRVNRSILVELLSTPLCSKIMNFPFQVTDVFKGNFPIGRARNFYGDRYILIGDSAGLVRPFKGKGINIAVLSGHYAARNLIQRGWTRQALSQIEVDFAEQIADLWYGRAARLMAKILSRFSLMDPLIDLAEHDLVLRQALFDSVSAHDTYRSIIRRMTASPGRMLRIGVSLGVHLLNGGMWRKSSLD
ncbi:MAG TPA: NAD(P)/FAD-dependent oxidoreductase [Candidatus Glassbacteria bacterium]|nr:NAD(P)/FAD-dependent oxidoreductase [Candidatus Glassbacteria bacterium]